MSHAAEARPLDGSVVGVEEWGALPEDQEGELVDGRIEEEEVPSYLHEVVVAWGPTAGTSTLWRPQRADWPTSRAAVASWSTSTTS